MFRILLFLQLLMSSLNSFSQIGIKMNAGYISGFHNITEQTGDKTDVSFYGTGFELGGIISYSTDNNFFKPHFGYTFRRVGTKTEYTIGDDALIYTMSESNRFSSHDLYLGNTIEIERFRFGISAGVSFYFWTSTKSTPDIKANQSTQFLLQQYTSESMQNTDPRYLIFIQPEASYSFNRKWSIYSQIVLPVWNTEKKLHIKSDMKDNWNDFTHETDISFQTFMWSVGLRYLIWKK